MTTPITLYVSVRRVRLNAGGYTSTGEYYGQGAPLYVATIEADTAPWLEPWEHTFRATDREEALDRASRGACQWLAGGYPAATYPDVLVKQATGKGYAAAFEMNQHRAVDWYRYQATCPRWVIADQVVCPRDWIDAGKPTTWDLSHCHERD